MLAYIQTMMIAAEAKIRDFFTKEDGAVDIVAIVVLMGIAILLAVVFKNQITTLLNTLFGKITTNANTVIDGGEV